MRAVTFSFLIFSRSIATVLSAPSKSLSRPTAFISFPLSLRRTSRDQGNFNLHATSMSTQASNSGRVVVVGSANQDLISCTPTVPTLGETVMGKTFETSCGGKGANQAIAAALLNIAPISMVCRVGPDSFGADLLNNFRKAGVEFDESSSVSANEGDHTGVASIVVDTKSGDNMIIVTPGTNYALTPDQVRDAISSSKPAVVVVQLEIRPEAALEACRAGKEVGAITILNTAPAPTDWTLDDFYPFVDILIPNETELRTIFGSDESDEEAMARALLAKGVGQAVIVTLGARGAMIVAKDADAGVNVTMVNAPDELPCKNDPVKDTIGAGDAFCGSLSAYLSSGLSLAESAKKACGVASMSVRKMGAQSSYPTADDLPDCLRLSTTKTSASKKPIITFVTGNKKKVEEIQQILSSDVSEFPFEITNRKVDLPELQGDPVEIAIEKCKIAAKQVRGAVLTEDTSLCFNALDALPGPYIKWFLEKCGHDGLNNMLTGFDDKSAYAQTIIAFTLGPDKEVHIFDGRTDGKIVPPRGSLDFGWDPVFEPTEGKGKTYGEMSKDEKNGISHRSRSMAKLKTYLINNADGIKSAI